MNIRKASITDLPKILDLYRELNPEDDELDLCVAEAIWKKSEAKNTITYLVAVENNEVVGTCNIAIIDNLTRSGRPYGIIENVITAIKYRRKGIGKVLIEKAVELAKINNCYKVILLSSSKRFEAHKFYEAIGFNSNSKKGFELRLYEK
jgi:N-acetylglutamate synthase-like GNAT family acetyltransferase